MLGGLPCLQDLSTWTNWLVFLKATYGLPLTPAEEVVFCTYTGLSRYRPPEHGWPEGVAITGRQGGKDRGASFIQAHEAMTALPEGDGTELYAVSIAQDQRSALRTAFSYVTAPFECVDELARHVIAPRAESWTLDNGVVLAAYPCRPESIRGLRACVVVCSELAFYRNSENQPVDVEM